MLELQQERFGNDSSAKEELSAPNEPHLACVLLLDTSGSMAGAPITSLNNAVNQFKEQVCKDPTSRKRIDIAIIEFNTDVKVVQEFTPISKMEFVDLTANGGTSMGKGINAAIDKVIERNQLYAKMGTPCYKPWIFMITDGAPTDDISSARARIAERESIGEVGKLKFWAVGVPGYDEDTLKSLSKRVIALKGADFTNIFDWLSKSMAIISVSQVTDNPQLGKLPEDARIIPPDLC